MAKQKAIMLGVSAERPFFSQRIDIGEADRWMVEIVCSPNHITLKNEIEAEVWYKDREGAEKFFMNSPTQIVGGASIQISLLRKIEGTKKVDVFLVED